MTGTVKILWLTEEYHPMIGGIATYVARITDPLAENDTVLLITNRGQHLSQASKVHHAVCSGLQGSRFSWRWKRIRHALTEMARKFHPDIIHLANAGMAVYAQDLSPVAPLVCSVHGNDFSSPWQLTPAPDVHSEIKSGLQRCSAILAVSNYTAGLLEKKGISTPVDVILNSCDTAHFYRRTIDRDTLLKKLGIPVERKIVLTVARMDSRKGHMTVLEALKRVSLDWHWVIIGSGRTRSKVEAAVRHSGLQGRVSFLGWVSYESLAEFYTLADLFVLVPEVITRGQRIDSEGFGLVYLEAGACGTPVIGVDSAGVREAIVDGQTGILVSSSDAAQIREAICRLLLDRGTAEEMGANAASRIHASGGWSAVASSVRQIYERVLGN